jgi:phosphoribosylglycinamide formyltransferase-1
MPATENIYRPRIIVLTGSEVRHRFFRIMIADDPDINVIASYCEGTEKSLKARVDLSPDATPTLRRHVEARGQSEHDFFYNAIKSTPDNSRPIHIKKGDINSADVIRDIVASGPDLLVCYGSSLIKGQLLEQFKGRFLNVHLGLSPYYRGSGANVWPLINNEPEFVGATFMYIDAGVDTGDIIHQIRAKLVLGDGPHSIGNRLIADMIESYKAVIKAFPRLAAMPQPEKIGGKLYYQKDFTSAACITLYRNFSNGLVENHLDNIVERNRRAPLIENHALAKAEP